MRFKITDIDQEQFYQLPKALFSQKNYKGLSCEAKVIYAFLKDRMWLSRKNRWIDEDTGDIFLLFKQSDLGTLLDLSVSSVSRAMKKLVEYQLIDIQQQGCNRPNKIYINRLQAVASEKDITEDPLEKTLGEENPELREESPCGTWTCTSANPDMHVRDSGLANMQTRTCRNETPDLHQCNPGLAPVQTNDTDINKTERKDTKNKNIIYIAEQAEAVKKDPLEDTALGRVVELYSNSIHPVSGGIELDRLAELLDTFGENAVVEAIAKSKFTNISYVEAVVKNRQRRDDTNGRNSTRRHNSDRYDSQDAASAEQEKWKKVTGWND